MNLKKREDSNMDIEKEQTGSADQTLDYYETVVETTALPICDNAWYACLGACGEVGEAAGKIKKVYRDKNGVFGADDRKAIIKELGDALWYLSVVARDLGFSLKDVLMTNAGKVLTRKARGTIGGSGDDR